ncbi:hypothetical protein GCM10027290_66560 [Micromonospora sonneratiae]
MGSTVSMRVHPLPDAVGTSGGGSSITSPEGSTGAGRRGGLLTITDVIRLTFPTPPEAAGQSYKPSTSPCTGRITSGLDSNRVLG